MILSTRPQLTRLSDRLTRACYGGIIDEPHPVDDFIERIDLRELQAFSSALKSYLRLDFEPFTVSVSDEVTTLQTVNPLVGGDPEEWIVKEEVFWEWKYPTCGSRFIERMDYWLQLVNEHETPAEVTTVEPVAEPAVEVVEEPEPVEPVVEVVEEPEPVEPVVEVVKRKPETPVKKRPKRGKVSETLEAFFKENPSMAGWTLDELAEKTGFKRSTIHGNSYYKNHRIENGRGKKAESKSVLDELK